MGVYIRVCVKRERENGIKRIKKKKRKTSPSIYIAPPFPLKALQPSNSHFFNVIE
jgi:hypothetical protein